MAASKAVASSLSECQCHLCMEILIEPLTFPCKHTVCKLCFQALLRKIELRCPFCRFWISSWMEYPNHRNAFLNTELWAKVQRLFPEECRLRALGQDSGLVFESEPPVHVLITPGELRREYEEEKSKMEAELKANKEKEEKASAEYIKSLLEQEEEEEEKMLAEKRLREMEEQLKREEEERQLSINNPVATKVSRKRKKKQNHHEAIPAQSQGGSNFAEGPREQDMNMEENMPTPAPQSSLESQNQGAKSTVKSPMLSSYAYDVEWRLEGNFPTPSSTGINSTKTKDTTSEGSTNSLLVSAGRKKMFRKSFPEPEEARISVMDKMAHLEQLYFEKHKQEEQDRLFALKLHEKLNKKIIKKLQKAAQKDNMTNDITPPPNSREMENERTRNSSDNDF